MQPLVELNVDAVPGTPRTRLPSSQHAPDASRASRVRVVELDRVRQLLVEASDRMGRERTVLRSRAQELNEELIEQREQVAEASAQILLLQEKLDAALSDRDALQEQRDELSEQFAEAQLQWQEASSRELAAVAEAQEARSEEPAGAREPKLERYCIGFGRQSWLTLAGVVEPAVEAHALVEERAGALTQAPANMENRVGTEVPVGGAVVELPTVALPLGAVAEVVEKAVVEAMARAWGQFAGSRGPATDAPWSELFDRLSALERKIHERPCGCSAHGGAVQGGTGSREATPHPRRGSILRGLADANINLRQQLGILAKEDCHDNP